MKKIHDTSYAKGFIGLWAKADSVTDVDKLHLTGFLSK